MKATSPLCVITGATGAVGDSVVQAFLKAGYGIRALSRRGGSGPAGIDHRATDVCNFSSTRAALEGADVIVHLAALLHINNPPADLEKEYRRVNVYGTENVLRAAPSGARVVCMSTIAVYGYASNAGIFITEEQEPHPETVYAQTKLAAERLVMDAGGTVLRLAAVYGARVKGNYRRLIQSIHSRRYVGVGRGDNHRTLVYDGDVGQASVLAAGHADAAGQIFNITDGAVHTVDEIVSAIASALGKRRPRIKLPVAPVRAMAFAVDALARMVGANPPITPDMIDKYTEEVAVSGAKAIRVLGFRPAFELQQGWIETVRLMREAGEI